MFSQRVDNQLNSQQGEAAEINNGRCSNPQPFMVFGSPAPYTLNYNLPDSSSFTVKGFIPVTFDKDDFKKDPVTPPVYNPWVNLLAEGGANLDAAIINLIRQTTKGPSLIMAFDAAKFFVTEPANFATSNPAINPNNLNIIISYLQTYLLNYNFSTGAPLGTNGLPLPPVIDGDTYLGRMSAYKNQLQDLLFQYYQILIALQTNQVPSLVTNTDGTVTIQFTDTAQPLSNEGAPTGIAPKLFIALTFKVTNFLGNYGAGKTVKTLSLLPGEKTNISIKTYRSSETVDSRVDNVLDSFTQKSLDSLDKFLEQETGTKTTKSGGGGFSLKLPLSKANPTTGGSLGFGGGFKSQTENMSKTINRALTKHVDESQNLRNVEVKTETKTTEKEGEETAIIREIANLNKSRVLNFVFRQLNQEYTSVTFVDEAGLLYSNGNDKDEAICSLAEINTFLETYLTEAGAEKIKNRVLALLCSFVDYTGSDVAFIEKISHTLKTLDGNGNLDEYEENGSSVVNTYCAKRKNLLTTVQIKDDGTTIGVPGIVMQVQKHILNTDSVIVDALLGQGEALDCYNIQLQQLNVLKEKLNHTEQLQKVEQISGVLNNADDFNKVYNHQIDKELLQAIAK